MVSLISAFHEHQVSIYIKRILQDIVNREVSLWDPKQIYSCFIFKRRVLTVSLENKKFKVRLTGRSGKHHVIFCYKTSGFSHSSFFRSVKRFLKAVFEEKPECEQTRKTFRHISKKYGIDITKLDTDYLLIVERLAVRQWFRQAPCLAGDFVTP